MRGYLTFILAIAVLAIFLHLFSIQPAVSLVKPLAVEDLYQSEQNVKFLILETIRTSSKEALFVYALSHPKNFNEQEAEAAIENAAYSSLLQLQTINFANSHAELFCGPKPLAYSNCENCKSISNCRNIVYAEVEKLGPIIRAEISLGTKDFISPQVLLIHTNSNNHPTSSLAYIPISEKTMVEVIPIESPA